MTTVRLLPETDLARIALLSDEERRIQLRRVKFGVPPHSYTPLRKSVPGLFNARKSLIELPACTLEDVEAAIQKDCRGHPEWIEPNLTLARLLFGFNATRALTAVEREFDPVPIGFGAKLKLWHDFYTVQNERPVVCFIDPRLHNGLTALGRRFTFSAMHHNLALGDFSQATFEILRFPKLKEIDDRYVRIYEFNISELVGEDEMNEAINKTYEIWAEVLAEREEEVRRHPSTGTEGQFRF
ncbi:MAG: hypothetical protein ACLQF4_06365 [Xanthobacteraceae bacterium]